MPVKPTRRQLAPNAPPASRVYGALRIDKLLTTLPHRFVPSQLDPQKCKICGKWGGGVNDRAFIVSHL